MSAILSVVIVTYKRQALLDRLLASFHGANFPDDAFICVIDNEGSAEAVCNSWTDRLPLHYRKSSENLGGSGGFNMGVEIALEKGADVCWLIDDDVAFLPNAYPNVAPYIDRFDALIARRKNPDGSDFFFQARFNDFFAVPFPVLGDPFKNSDHCSVNVLSFEGAIIHKRVFDKIGLPDRRFFITWDDAIFGWVADHFFEVALVNTFTLERTISGPNVSLGIRPVSATGDLSKYYSLYNRHLVKEYFKIYRRYKPLGFALGTILVTIREILRAVIVEKRISGLPHVWRGLRDLLAKRSGDALVLGS